MPNWTRTSYVFYAQEQDAVKDFHDSFCNGNKHLLCALKHGMAAHHGWGTYLLMQALFWSKWMKSCGIVVAWKRLQS